MIEKDIDHLNIDLDGDGLKERYNIKDRRVDEFNKYSTEEKVVGEWIDGKPIYEKTYVINADIPAGTTGCNIASGIDNKNEIKSFINCIGVRERKDGYNPVALNLNIWFESETSIVVSSVAAFGSVTYIIIQYTKTTD